MTDSKEGAAPPSDVPDSLIEEIDTLDLPTLKAVKDYVDRRVGSLREPMQAAIEADSAGEVIEIEDHGAYALVRQHPPNPNGPGLRTDVVSLYHVRRQVAPSGEETLQWSYVGDVEGPEVPRCPQCNHPVEDDTGPCQHCGYDRSKRTANDDTEPLEDS